MPINEKQEIMKRQNSKKNNFKIISYLFFTILVIFISSCKKDEPDCGCESETTFTIDESYEQTGFLYKYIDEGIENIPNHNYGIHFSDIDCVNCVHTFFICNDESLDNISNIPIIYPGIEVKFAGYAKKVCKQITAPADYTYNYITLTKIEQQ
jgi:hypothetical protein